MKRVVLDIHERQEEEDYQGKYREWGESGQRGLGVGRLWNVKCWDGGMKSRCKSISCVVYNSLGKIVYFIFTGCRVSRCYRLSRR